MQGACFALPMRELVLDSGWQLKEWPSSLSDRGGTEGDEEGPIAIEQRAAGLLSGVGVAALGRRDVAL